MCSSSWFLINCQITTTQGHVHGDNSDLAQNNPMWFPSSDSNLNIFIYITEMSHFLVFRPIIKILRISVLVSIAHNTVWSGIQLFWILGTRWRFQNGHWRFHNPWLQWNDYWCSSISGWRCSSVLPTFVLLYWVGKQRLSRLVSPTGPEAEVVGSVIGSVWLALTAEVSNQVCGRLPYPRAVPVGPVRN